MAASAASAALCRFPSDPYSDAHIARSERFPTASSPFTSRCRAWFSARTAAAACRISYFRVCAAETGPLTTTAGFSIAVTHGLEALAEVPTRSSCRAGAIPMKPRRPAACSTRCARPMRAARNSSDYASAHSCSDVARPAFSTSARKASTNGDHVAD